VLVGARDPRKRESDPDETAAATIRRVCGPRHRWRAGPTRRWERPGAPPGGFACLIPHEPLLKLATDEDGALEIDALFLPYLFMF
jgi:hypothetical protein